MLLTLILRPLILKPDFVLTEVACPYGFTRSVDDQLETLKLSLWLAVLQCPFFQAGELYPNA
jgi:hypothetical protein